MSQMDDDNIEKVFRQADPGRFDTAYNEDDWKRMEAMLDKERERIAALKKRRLFIGAAAAVLMVAISVSLYTLRDNPSQTRDNGVSKSNQSNVASTDTNSNKKEGDGVVEHELNVDNNPPESQTTESQAAYEKSASTQNESSVNNQTNHGKIDQPLVNSNKRKSENNFNRQATSGEQNDVKINGKDVATDAGVSGLLLSEGDVNEQSRTTKPDPSESMIEQNYDRTVAEDKSESKDMPNQRSATETRVDSVEMKQNVELLAEDSIQENGVADEKKRTEFARSRWMISGVVAPDFSRTAYSGYDSPGDAFGVFVHYQFLKRWGISTGVLRSNKKYWGYGDEYNPPSGYWEYVTNGVVPEKVDGNCLVLEVPLSLAYNVVETRRTRVFVTAGISSYFMRSEKYTYTFDEPNPGSANGWSTDEPSSYLFGIGSLSVGYDYRVSPTLSFGLEPYYRIPFAEVGWANVDLYSLGFLFNARYRFLKKEHLSSPPGALK